MATQTTHEGWARLIDRSALKFPRVYSCVRPTLLRPCPAATARRAVVRSATRWWCSWYCSQRPGTRWMMRTA